MVEFEQKEHYTLEDLRQVVRILRTPVTGCPWDSIQTHESIRRDFIEETLEACEAIDRQDPALLREELGDVLFQVLFHADIEDEAGRFNFDDVADEVCHKMIYRHPHVFGSEHFDEVASELNRWDALKQVEKSQQTYSDTLNAVAKTLPGLWYAEKLQKKASKAGFVWPDAPSAVKKLEEEVGELDEAVREQTNIEEELGDTLFAAVGAARLLGLDPEEALRKTCAKYIARFTLMEQAAADQGTPLDTLNVDEQMKLWNAAKHQEHL